MRLIRWTQYNSVGDSHHTASYYFFKSRNDLKKSNGPSLRQCGRWCQKVFDTEENYNCYLETDDNTTNWTWSAWDFKQVKWGTQSVVIAMEAASKEWKNAVNGRISKKAEITAKPLNILENILLLLRLVNWRLSALYFWYVAGLVQPYYVIELHLQDYLNVWLSMSPINMRLLNDW